MKAQNAKGETQINKDFNSILFSKLAFVISSLVKNIFINFFTSQLYATHTKKKSFNADSIIFINFFNVTSNLSKKIN